LGVIRVHPVSSTKSSFLDEKSSKVGKGGLVRNGRLVDIIIRVS